MHKHKSLMIAAFYKTFSPAKLQSIIRSDGISLRVSKQNETGITIPVCMLNNLNFEMVLSLNQSESDIWIVFISQ